MSRIHKIFVIEVLCYSYAFELGQLSSLLNINGGLLVDSDLHWDVFKKTYNKSYASISHEMKAHDAWKKNIAAINLHNSLGHSYKLRANHLSDLTLRQYLKQIVKLVKSNDDFHNHTLPRNVEEKSDIPEEVDWRQVGFKPKLVSQQRCGACYAFSAAHALQAQLYITKNQMTPLSEQQIVDCSSSFGNYGCGGGSLRNTFKYLQIYGVMRNTDYPFEAKVGKCRWNSLKVKAIPTSWGMIPKHSEKSLERAVALIGPIAVSLNAAPHTFTHYHSGIYDDPECNDKHVNHAMLVVGYTKDYWILLNWWGAHWGEQGYMKLKKGANHCGVSNMAGYVIVE